MALIRWNPWNISSLWGEDLEFPTIPGLSRIGQGLDVYETKDFFIVEAALPGVAKDKIDVTVSDDTLRISGSYQKKEEEQGKRYFMRALNSSFNYAIRLPNEVIKSQEPEASYSQGILKLSFKKKQQEEVKKIPIKEATAQK